MTSTGSSHPRGSDLSDKTRSSRQVFCVGRWLAVCKPEGRRGTEGSWAGLALVAPSPIQRSPLLEGPILGTPVAQIPARMLPSLQMLRETF